MPKEVVLKRLSEEMRDRMDRALQAGLAANIPLTEDHWDQAQVNERLQDGSHGYNFFCSYTHYGIANMEATFLSRLSYVEAWDSKDRIREDILSNPHLHENIKTRLLRDFDKTNWNKWYDAYYFKKIFSSKPGEYEGVYQEIKGCPHLFRKTKGNLLRNLKRMTLEQRA